MLDLCQKLSAWAAYVNWGISGRRRRRFFSVTSYERGIAAHSIPGWDRLTTTLPCQREWLADIIAGDKRVEYRRMKPYWRRRLWDRRRREPRISAKRRPTMRIWAPPFK